MNTSPLPLVQAQKSHAGDTYLKLKLNQHHSASLLIEHTQEAIVIAADRVTAMPNMPECILGLINWRSRILWLVDLSAMLGFSPIDSRLRQYSVIIVRSESQVVGLAVEVIQGITKIIPGSIQSPVLSQLPGNLIPYLRGCIWQDKQQIFVLDSQAIIHAEIFQIN